MKNELFVKLLAKFCDPVVDNFAYHNGTGYFDPLSTFPVDRDVTFIDNDYRRVVVMPTRVGKARNKSLNVVVFQRYGTDREEYLVHLPLEVRELAGREKGSIPRLGIGQPTSEWISQEELTQLIVTCCG